MHRADSILRLQRAIGNQALQRILHADAEELQARLTGTPSPRFEHDFSRIPTHPPAAGAIQTKQAINQPGDEYEREADRISEQMMHMPGPQRQRACPCGGGCPRCQAEQPGQEHERLQTKRLQAGNLDQSAVPPVVHQVLASPGQPLEAATRAFMESHFGHDFGRIRIHTDSPAARSAEVLGADAYTFGTHIAFAHARFLPGTEHGNRLMAHELTHAIQQARLPRLRANESGPVVDHNAPGLAHPDRSVHIGTTASPHLALRPKKAPGGSIFVGMLLGWNRELEQVFVKREVGATQGYDDRLQAIAVARLGGAEPAAVVQGSDKKWHALETTANFEVGLVSADDTGISQETASHAAVKHGLVVHGLPSTTGIAVWDQKVNSLKNRLDELQNLKKSGSDRKAIKQDESQVVRDLAQANLTRASLIFGVPESEIQFNRSSFDRKSGKININPNLAYSGVHGLETRQGEDFEPGMLSAFEINLKQLENPAHAHGTLFHEVTHLKDYELAQQWVKKYVDETKRIFVSGPPGRKVFEDWIKAQVPARLSMADAELVVDIAANLSATTEARANVRTFLSALQDGALDVATEALATYANELKPGGQYASPAHGSAVQAALIKELQSSYRQMSKEMQRQFDDAVAAAKKKNPSAWVSELDFSK